MDTCGRRPRLSIQNLPILRVTTVGSQLPAWERINHLMGGIIEETYFSPEKYQLCIQLEDGTLTKWFGVVGGENSQLLSLESLP